MNQYKFFTSLEGWPKSWILPQGSIWAPKTHGGMLEDMVRYAHKVFVPYCTSDAYIGNATRANYIFHGRKVFQAVLDFVLLKKRLNNGTSTRLLLSGCSAGGRGVMQNLDFTVQWLQLHLQNKQDLLFLPIIDSGLYLDRDPLYAEEGFAPIREQAKGVIDFLGAKSTVSENCTNDVGTENAWMCLIGEYAIPLLTWNGTVVHAFQYDQYQLSHDMGLPFSLTNDTIINAALDTIRKNSSMAAYSDDFASRTVEVLETSIRSRGMGVFSAACFHHCNTEEENFSHSFRVGNLSFAQYVENMVINQANPKPAVEVCEVRSCNCGSDCQAK